MRHIVLLIGIAGGAWAQNMTEFGAAAAGGAVGGAAGKKISDGLTSVLEKVDKQTADAAKDKDKEKGQKTAPAREKALPVVQANSTTPSSGGTGGGGAKSGGSAIPKGSSAPASKPAPQRASVRDGRDPSMVPPPPPLSRPAVAIKRQVEPVAVAIVAPPPPPPPPPQVTRQDLATVGTGTNRDELLKLGQPASRITWADGGHLVEVYRYTSDNATVGVVNLSDGAVSSVQVR